jgi:hypothetical protein
MKKMKKKEILFLIKLEINKKIKNKKNIIKKIIKM